MIVGEAGNRSVFKYSADDLGCIAKQFITFLESVLFIEQLEIWNIEMDN